MKQKRASIITVGHDKSEIKIYCLHRADGYTFRQCCWYGMGRRQVKIFRNLNAAKLFAQQKSVALANGLAVDVAASYRDVEILRSCEQRASRFGTTLPAAIEEWAAARDVISKGSLIEAVRFHVLHNAGLPRRTVSELIPAFIEAKKAAQYSNKYLRGLKWQLGKLELQLGGIPSADVTTPQVDEFLRGLNVANVTRNGMRKSVVSLFSWARKQGCLLSERATAAEKSMKMRLLRRNGSLTCGTRRNAILIGGQRVSAGPLPCTKKSTRNGGRPQPLRSPTRFDCRVDLARCWNNSCAACSYPQNPNSAHNVSQQDHPLYFPDSSNRSLHARRKI